MKRITDGEYVVVDKKTGTVRLWHDCNRFRGKEDNPGRVELEPGKKHSGLTDFTCPRCGYGRTIEVGLFLPPGEVA